MRARQWLVKAGVVLLLVGLLLPASLARANGVTVTLDAPAQVREGSDFVARLNISYVVNFDAAVCRIRFDPAILSLTGATAGKIGGTTIPVGTPVEKGSGLWGVVANVPGFPGVTGEGYLMEFHFHALATGTSALGLEHYSMSDSQAQSILAVWVGDSAEVFSSDALGIDYSPAGFTFTAVVEDTNCGNQTLEIWNAGLGALDWSVTDDAAWLNLEPLSGSYSGGPHGLVILSVDISGMSAGSYSGTITISGTLAVNTPQEVPVELIITPASIPPIIPPIIPPASIPPASVTTDGGGAGSLTVDVLGNISTATIVGGCNVVDTVTVLSPDGTLTVTIPGGTCCRNMYGGPLSNLEVTVDESPPPPPEYTSIVGLVYSFEPGNATFSPPITLTWKYDPGALPEGVAEEDLVLAYYDEQAKEWVELDCTVDTENNTVTASVSHLTTFAMLAGTAPMPVVFDVMGNVYTSYIVGSCWIVETVTPASPDENLAIYIAGGTCCRNKYGDPLSSLTVTGAESPPPPPENRNIIGLAYSFKPSGSTFSPPIMLTLKYDPDALPEGVAEEDLVLAYYDEQAGEWVELECTVDTENNTITASISHFTTFALMAPAVPPPSALSETSPEGATLTFGSMNISPSEVNVGETVTITVLVSNNSDVAGSGEAVLKVNGVVEAAKGVTVGAGKSESVSFTVSKDSAGTCSVDVNGITKSFLVKKVPATPIIETKWFKLGLAIAAYIALLWLIFFLALRRKRRRQALKAAAIHLRRSTPKEESLPVPEVVPVTIREFTAEDKICFIVDCYRYGVSIEDICRREDIEPEVFKTWVQDFIDGIKEMLPADTVNYDIRIEAEAVKAEAEARAVKAEAEARAVKAEAEARAVKAEAEARAMKAEAEARAVKAEAEAWAVKAEAEAEAVKTEAEAEAVKTESVRLDRLESLKRLVAELSLEVECLGDTEAPDMDEADAP